MKSNKDIKKIKVEEGMGIWGNYECKQCGACCYEYNKYLYEVESKETAQCENFKIEGGKAHCLAYEDKRKELCEKWFCGNTDFRNRFKYRGDKKLRNIANKLGTTPADYKIPVLIYIL